MDSTKRDNKEVQEKLMALQKEKDQVGKYKVMHILYSCSYMYVDHTYIRSQIST